MTDDVKVNREQLERWARMLEDDLLNEDADKVLEEIRALLPPPAPERDRWSDEARKYVKACAWNLTETQTLLLADHFRAVHEREIEDLKQTERDVLASLSGAVREQERLRAAVHHERDERTKLMRELRARPLPSAREIASEAVEAFLLAGRKNKTDPIGWHMAHLDAATAAVARVLESKGEGGASPVAESEGASPPDDSPVSSPTPEEIVKLKERGPLECVRCVFGLEPGEDAKDYVDSVRITVMAGILSRARRERDGARADANEYERQCELEMNAKLEARARVEELERAYDGQYQRTTELSAEVDRLRGALEPSSKLQIAIDKMKHRHRYPTAPRYVEISDDRVAMLGFFRTALDGGGEEDALAELERRARAIGLWDDVPELGEWIETKRIPGRDSAGDAEGSGAPCTDPPAPSLSGLLEAVEELHWAEGGDDPDRTDRAVAALCALDLPALRSDLEANEAVVGAAFEWLRVLGDGGDDNDTYAAVQDAVRAHPRYPGGDGREA